jgi:2-iminobutanoate/2-iminopropanoate deaminase
MRDNVLTPADPRSHVPTPRHASAVRRTLGVLALAVLAGCAHRSPAVAEYLTPYGPPQYPFSPAVRVGHTLYLAGQIGDANGALVPGGIEAETRQTLRNIADILEKSGSSLDRVVKCTVFMADMAEWPRMNTVYRTFFTKHLPARSAFGTTGLALGARVEIECLATVG